MRHPRPCLLAALILLVATGACGGREVSPLEPGAPVFATRSDGNGEFPGSPTEDVVISTVINSQGGTDNFVMKIVLHFAADGSVQVDKSSEECRG